MEAKSDTIRKLNITTIKQKERIDRSTIPKSCDTNTYNPFYSIKDSECEQKKTEELNKTNFCGNSQIRYFISKIQPNKNHISSKYSKISKPFIGLIGYIDPFGIFILNQHSSDNWIGNNCLSQECMNK